MPQLVLGQVHVAQLLLTLTWVSQPPAIIVQALSVSLEPVFPQVIFSQWDQPRLTTRQLMLVAIPRPLHKPLWCTIRRRRYLTWRVYQRSLVSARPALPHLRRPRTTAPARSRLRRLIQPATQLRGLSPF